MPLRYDHNDFPPPRRQAPTSAASPYVPQGHVEGGTTNLGEKKSLIFSRRGLILGALGLLATAGVGTGVLLSREKGPSGSQLLELYDGVDGRQNQFRYVLEQAATENMPSTWNKWVTVTDERTFRGEKIKVEFFASPHGLRVGNDEDWVEIPVDGPHAAAIAKALKCELASKWMVDAIYEQAKKTGGAVHFWDSAALCRSVESNDNACTKEKINAEMMSTAYTREKNKLLHEFLKEHNIKPEQLIADYFKTVLHPVPGLTKLESPGLLKLRADGTGVKGQYYLEFTGGRRDDGTVVQPGYSIATHPADHADCTHGVRLVRPVVMVNGVEMTLSAFENNTRFALAFGFNQNTKPGTSYKYPDALKEWMEKNGYMEKSEEEKKKEEEEKKKKEAEEKKKKK